MSYQRVDRGYNPRKINRYVPACQYAAEVSEGMVLRVDFGTPAAASATAIANAMSIATAGAYAPTGSDTSTEPYGRNVTIVLSGAGTPTVDIRGRDYLGQPVRETLTGNGATPVLGKKAFMWIDSITTTAVAATTMNVGWGAQLGLPYKCISVVNEQSDGALATSGTLTAPVLTDPQTATTGDPRGTYAPNTTPDGAKNIIATFVADAWINSSGNGGLQGIMHLYS